MKKTQLGVFALILVAAIAVSVVSAAAERARIDLTPVGGSTASGKADIRKSVDKNTNKVDIRVDVSNVSLPAGRILEGWLVDSDSGFILSMGAFEMKSKGRASLQFKQRMVNFDVFDKIMVTSEDISDSNPAPDASILEAAIPALTGQANIVEMRADLMGSQQVPPVETSATGTGEFKVDTTHNTVTFKIDYQDLSALETASHIHGFAAEGSNTGVLFPLPLGVEKKGVWNYTEDQESGILGGLTYVNVHSENFPNGEIRGQILPKSK